MEETSQRLAGLQQDVLSGEAAEIEQVRMESQEDATLEAWRENAEQMRRLIDTLPVCMAYVDSEQIYRLNNKTYEEWIGRKRSEITGRHIKEVLGHDLYVSAQESIEAALSGQVVNFETTMPVIGGGERHVSATYVPDVGKQGEIKGFYALIADVSRRKRAEVQLRFQAQLLDSVRESVVATDTEGHVVYWGKGAEALYRYSADEVMGKLITFIVEPGAEEEEQERMHQVLEKGSWSGQYVQQRKDGSSFWADTFISLVTDEQGQPAGLIGIDRDITKRKEAEERIRRQATRADALVRAAARLNAHLTLDAVLDAVCEETARALDAPAVLVLLYDEVQGALYPGATRGLPPEYSEGYTPTPRALYEDYVRKQGPLILVPDVQAEPNLPNAELYARYDIRTIVVHSLIREGQLVGTLNVYNFGETRTFDDDELALLKGLADQAAQAVENAQLRQQAEHSAVMEERGRLARELHDSVTQSLYSVTLLAEGWRRLAGAGRLEHPEEALTELGEIAQQALKEMRLLVYELRPPALEREGLLGALHKRLGAVEKRAGVEARLVAEDVVELPASVEEGLYRIAQEALNNALKHATATSVTVYFRANDGKVELEVVDDGRGFDSSAIDDQRGMGLASMQERAEKLGGLLAIDSGPGVGTKVKVSVGTHRNSGELT